MSLVLDASVTIEWVTDKTSSASVRAVFAQVFASNAWVPALWHLEVANVPQIGVRRKQHTDAFRDEALADLALYPIRIDPETHQRAWGATMQLAVRHRLTLYDASYLELALRRGLPLATLDRELQAATLMEGLQVLCK